MPNYVYDMILLLALPVPTIIKQSITCFIAILYIQTTCLMPIVKLNILCTLFKNYAKDQPCSLVEVQEIPSQSH